MTGGQPDIRKGRAIKHVWKFDGLFHTWKMVTQLTMERRHHGACGSHTELFLLGGFGNYRQKLDSFQKYDTEAGLYTLTIKTLMN